MTGLNGELASCARPDFHAAGLKGHQQGVIAAAKDGSDHYPGKATGLDHGPSLVGNRRTRGQKTVLERSPSDIVQGQMLRLAVGGPRGVRVETPPGGSTGAPS